MSDKLFCKLKENRFKERTNNKNMIQISLRYLK